MVIEWCAQYASCVYTCAVKDMVVSKSGEAIKNTSPVWLCTSNSDGSLRRKVNWAFVPMSASVALTVVTDVPTGVFSTRDAVYMLWAKTGRLSLTSYRERKARQKPMRHSTNTCSKLSWYKKEKTPDKIGELLGDKIMLTICIMVALWHRSNLQQLL